MQAARRLPRSVAVDEIQQEVGLPHVTAVTRAGPDEFQITERDWVWLGVPPDRRI
jgi:hypothetical protein